MKLATQIRWGIAGCGACLGWCAVWLGFDLAHGWWWFAAFQFAAGCFFVWLVRFQRRTLRSVIECDRLDAIANAELERLLGELAGHAKRAPDGTRYFDLPGAPPLPGARD